MRRLLAAKAAVVAVLVGPATSPVVQPEAAVAA
jgi:hypothetical protein